jgi:PAT family beta-lactamase induction signal transducer AmpG
MASILGFAVLNESGPNTMVLGAVVAFEYLGVGLGSAALMAYIAANTNKSFTGTQLALLTSIFAIPKSFSGIMAGVIVEGIGPKDTWFYEIFGAMQGQGYTNFFFICTILAIPGMLLLFWIAPWNGKALKNS